MFSLRLRPWTQIFAATGLSFLLPCVAAAQHPVVSPNALPPSFYGFSPGYYGPYLPGHYQYGSVNPSVYSNYAFPTPSGYGVSNVPLQYSYPLNGSFPAGSSTPGYVPSLGRYNYAVPAFVSSGANASAQGNTQVIAEVHMPTPNAELWVEGRRTGSTGTWRWFASPPLVPGDRYVYDFRARWSENGQEVVRDRQVPVRAGEPIIVDFTRPAKASAVASAPRAPSEQGGVSTPVLTQPGSPGRGATINH